MWFSPGSGILCCDSCRHPEDSLPVAPGVLAALRHVLYGPFEKSFAFTLPAGDLKAMGECMEKCLLAQFQRHFKTLDFYRTLTENE